MLQQQQPFILLMAMRCWGRRCMSTSHRPTFAEIGVRPALARNLESQLGLAHPTVQQRDLVTLLQRAPTRDVVLRDLTGSGKSLALVLALLNLPRRVPPIIRRASREEDLTTTKASIRPAHVLLLPHTDLAAQCGAWAAAMVHGMPAEAARAAVMVATDVSALSTPSPDAEPSTTEAVGPHLLITTPGVATALTAAGRVNWTEVGTLAIDEVDGPGMAPPPPTKGARSRGQMLNMPPSDAAWKSVTHPTPLEAAVRAIVDARAGNGRHPAVGSSGWWRALPRMVAASASASAAVRAHLKRGVGMIRADNCAFLDAMPSVPSAAVASTATPPETAASFELAGLRAPAGITHAAMLVVAQSDADLDPQLLDVTDPAAAASLSFSGPFTARPASGPSSSQDWNQETAPTDPTPTTATTLTQQALAIVRTARALGVTHALVVPVGPRAPGCSAVIAALQFAGVATDEPVSAAFWTAPTPPSPSDSEAKSVGGAMRFTVVSSTGARGLDAPAAIDVVFVIGAARSTAEYVHAVGRVGRFGKPGAAVSVVGTAKQAAVVRRMWRELGWVANGEVGGNGAQFQTVKLASP